ncbi:MAG: tetrahydrofolate dehydrogenase/cyclohydrolase catalytic domain-containing protein, partial [Gemmatimonadota bacterium]
MSAEIISGKEIAQAIRGETTERVAALKEHHDFTPGLATVLVGVDPASQSYVGMKNKAAKEMGIYSRQITLDADVSE